jgi:hypothetical protein
MCRVPGLIPILQGLLSAGTLQRDVQHSVRLTNRKIIDTPFALHYQINERFTPEKVHRMNDTKLHYFYPYSYSRSSSIHSTSFSFSSPSLFSHLPPLPSLSLHHKFKLLHVFCLTSLAFMFLTDVARSEFRLNLSFVNSSSIYLTNFYRMGQKCLTVFFK